jgi:hypothetical protein
MTIEQFRQQLKTIDLEARKQQKRDVLNLLCYGGTLFSITYAEIYHLQNVQELVARKNECLQLRGQANTRQFKEMLVEAGFFREIA